MITIFNALVESDKFGRRIRLFEQWEDVAAAFVAAMRDKYDYQGPDDYEEAEEFWQSGAGEPGDELYVQDAGVEFGPRSSWESHVIHDLEQPCPACGKDESLMTAQDAVLYNGDQIEYATDHVGEERMPQEEHARRVFCTECDQHFTPGEKLWKE